MTNQIECSLWGIPKRTTTWPIVQVRSTSKKILNYGDQLDRLPTMTKIRLDNYMTDHIDMVYIENETELSWPMGLGTVYDENQIGQWCEWL